LLELFESAFAEEFQECSGLAAGDDEAINFLELLRFLDKHNFSAQLFEPPAVRVEIALQCQHADLQGSGWPFVIGHWPMEPAG
jgi:hypothetical protein